jgi:hypothetical protein
MSPPFIIRNWQARKETKGNPPYRLTRPPRWRTAREPISFTILSDDIVEVDENKVSTPLLHALKNLSPAQINETTKASPSSPTPSPATTTTECLMIEDIASHIEQTLLNLFKTLPEDHPIFGVPADGLVRQPLFPVREKGKCWASTCKNLGRAVEKQMGRKVPVGSCWMSHTKQVILGWWDPNKSNKNGDTGGWHYTRRIQAVRLIAFLNAPTDKNWENLCSTTTFSPNYTGGITSADTPFSHACNAGFNKPGETGCINGLEHGRFATVQENDSHKSCKNGAAALCPGHGEPSVKCIFVHSDGLPKPCRNKASHVPMCHCSRACY